MGLSYPWKVKLSATIKYQVDGREVSKEEFLGSVGPFAAVRRWADAKAAEVARSLSCQQHDAVPIITVVQSGRANLKFSIRGCCDDLKSRARNALKGQPRPKSDTDAV